MVVDTRRQPGWVDRAWQRIREEVAAGRQAYVVCARITTPDATQTPAAGEDLLGGTEDGQAPAVAAEDLYAELSGGPLADLRVDLLHGQLPRSRRRP